MSRQVVLGKTLTMRIWKLTFELKIRGFTRFDLNQQFNILSRGWP